MTVTLTKIQGRPRLDKECSLLPCREKDTVSGSALGTVWGFCLCSAVEGVECEHELSSQVSRVSLRLGFCVLEVHSILESKDVFLSKKVKEGELRVE